MVRNFGISSRLAYTDLPTENEDILPCGSRDKPIGYGIATCLTTIFWSVTVPIHDDVITALRHTRRLCDISQIGVRVLSMANFGFLKSDH